MFVAALEICELVATANCVPDGAITSPVVRGRMAVTESDQIGVPSMRKIRRWSVDEAVAYGVIRWPKTSPPADISKSKGSRSPVWFTAAGHSASTFREGSE